MRRRCKKATDTPPGKRYTVHAAAAFLLLAIQIAPALSQDDISTFRVTDFGGELSIRYLLDDWRNSNPEGTTSFVTNPSWYEELTLRARGYVYHPAFLDWAVDGGPMLVQYRYESEAGNNSGSETLFNFGAELNFLNLRAYPFTLYLRRDHPDITSGSSGRFLAETNRYGIRGQLRAPLSPISILWEVYHYDVAGSGLGTTVDEDQDRALLTASLAFRERHDLRLDLDWHERNSKSGAPGLPIQESTIRTATAELSESSEFGDTAQILLRQNLIWFWQETRLAAITELETLNYTSSLRWQHTEATRSFANLRYYDTERTGAWSRITNLSAGVVHEVFQDFTVSGDGDYSTAKAPGFSEDVAGARATGNYRRSLVFGSLGINASLGMERTDRQSDTDQVTIFDESVVLLGTAPVALSRDFVVPASVVVTNVPKTQTFVPDIDYRLVTIGNTTTIERLITGSIEDGQTVLVSYDTLTGGTVKFDTLTQGFNLNLGLWRYASLFLNYTDTGNDVIEGFSTTPLNDINRIELGGRLDYPFTSGWTVGGEYRYTNQDEDISPYIRNSYDVYTQSGRYWNTSIRLQVHRETVDLEYSVEDVDLYRYILGVTSRLPGGLILTYNAEYSEDTGGTLLRKEKRHSLRLYWGYRQMQFSLQADRADITQGDNNRDSTRVTALLRRVF